MHTLQLVQREEIAVPYQAHNTADLFPYVLQCPLAHGADVDVVDQESIQDIHANHHHNHHA
jgi:hypothetical protein